MVTLTLIAAVVHDGKVHMLGDSFTGMGDIAARDARPKVWTAGDMVLGASGNVRPILVFRYGFQFPEQPDGQDDDTYMRFTFPAALRRFLREHVLCEVHEGAENYSLALLIGWRGRLWQMSDDLTVTTSTMPYDAIGSGREVALGALAVTPGLPPASRLSLAGDAAAELIWSVRPPWTSLVEPLEAVEPEQPRLKIDHPATIRHAQSCATCTYWTPSSDKIGRCAVLAVGTQVHGYELRPDRDGELLTPSTFGCGHHEART